MEGRLPRPPRPTNVLAVEETADDDKQTSYRAAQTKILLRFSRPRPFHHFQEALSGIFDIGIAILMGAALHCQQCATMDVFEIAKRKFGSRFAALNMCRVDSEMPL